jgi:gliding motility-associated-like protein
MLLVCYAEAQIVINELSQGPSGAKEYIEFLVIGTPTCDSSTVDIRGWIIDDNNGWHAMGSGHGISAGHKRFNFDPQWATVRMGSIILVYNNEDVNALIPPDDPTDANHDCVYILPGNSSYLDHNSTIPTSSLFTPYAGSTYTSSGLWSPIAMGNGDDAFQTVDPLVSTRPYFSIGWNSCIDSNTVYYAGTSSGRVVNMLNLIDDNPFNAANYSRDIISSGAYETPGAPNNAANSAWIGLMNNGCRPITGVYVTRDTSICSGYSIFAEGAFQTVAGAYFDTVLAVGAGCDTFYTTNLSVRPTSTGSISQSICAGTSYFFNGLNLTLAGTYLDTFVNYVGCDSVITLDLTVRSVSTFTINQQICSGTSYFFNGDTLTAAGIYLDTFLNYTGCDSVLTLSLTIIPTTSGTLHSHICSNDSIFFNGVYLHSAGTYNDTLVNAAGCDSFLTLTLSILPISYGTLNITICNGQSYIFNGIGRTISGMYADTLTNITGCDSFLTLTLLVNPTSTSTQNIVLCSPATYSINGHSYSSTGVYSDTLRNFLSCDSVVTTRLTIHPTSTFTRNIAICYDQFFFAQGANRNITGLYHDTLTNYLSCDSFLTTNLTVIPLVIDTQHIAICRGSSYFCQGAARTIAGNYFDTLFAYTSCDSLLVTSLIVNNETYHSRLVNICAGQSYNCGGGLQTTAGIYYDTLVNTSFCDSILTTNLVVNRIDSVYDTITICAGTSYGGHIFAADSALTFRLNNIFTCDSFFILWVHVHPLPLANAGADDTICMGNAVILSASGGITYAWSVPGSVGNNISVTPMANTTYTVTVTDANNCSATDNITIAIKTISLGVTIQQVLCNGANDGRIQLIPAGGKAPYTYLWSDALHQTTATAITLVAGTYYVTVSDSTLCSVTDTFVITEPSPIFVNAFTTNVGCYGDSSGTAVLGAIGGTGAYRFSTSLDGAYFYAGNSLTQLPAGIYTTTCTDANGCVSTFSFTITQPNPIVFNYITANPKCYGYADGSIFVNVTGGTYPYAINLDGKTATDGWFINLSAGDHHVDITDAAGCSQSYIIPMVQPSPIIVDIIPDTIHLALGATGQFNIAFTGVSPDSANFIWTAQDGLGCTDCPNPMVSPYTDQVYQVTIIDRSNPFNPNPCTGSAFGYVFVGEGDPVYIPNAFTPNGDGQNDLFLVFGKSLKNVRMEIFDRYGELLFEGMNQDDGWDGSFHGKLAEPGVYMYNVRIEYLNGVQTAKSGSITLVR